MNITRYELQTDENGSQTLVEAKHGEFVEYTDHLADKDAALNGALTAAANAEAEVERLRDLLNEAYGCLQGYPDDDFMERMRTALGGAK